MAARLVLIGFLFACRGAPTQLLVVVDSNIDELRSVFVSVARENGESLQTQCWDRVDSAAGVTLPFSFGVVQPDDDSSTGVAGRSYQGPTVRVVVSGLSTSCANASDAPLLTDTLVVRSAVTGFVSNTTLRLPFFLSRECRDLLEASVDRMPCPEGQTCGDEGICVGEYIEPSELDETSPGQELGDGSRPSPTDSGVELMDGAMDSCIDCDDAAMDADAAPVDAPAPGPARPEPYFPWSGYTTGSIHHTDSDTVTFRWRGSVDAVRYELELDRDCASPGTPIESCDFAGATMFAVSELMYTHTFTELSSDIPVGERVVWRVRGCDSDVCGAWSSYRYVDVGRMHTDINGDGYGDVVVSKYFAPFIILGGTGFDNGFDIGATFPFTVEHPGLAVGDINGDGFADIAAASPTDSSADAAELEGAYVWFGSEDFDLGVSGADSMSINNPDAAALGPHGFGYALAIGDWDGDGVGELAVSAPLQLNDSATSRNRVTVFGRLESAPRVVGSFAGTNTTVVPEPGFGADIHMRSDIDTDGLIDLVVGDPLAQSERGAVSVFASTGDMLCRHAGSPGSRMGWSIAVGDRNADSLPEIFAGAPRADEVRISEGCQGFSEVEEPPDGRAPVQFGYAVAVGDFNNDGRDDIAVGATEDLEGAVWVILGGTGQASKPTFEDIPGGGGITTHLGGALASTDTDGDGLDDLMVGAISIDTIFGLRSQGGADPFPTASMPTIDRSQPGLGNTFAR